MGMGIKNIGSKEVIEIIKNIGGHFFGQQNPNQLQNSKNNPTQ